MTKTQCLPTPRILLGYRNRDWTIAGAISEQIDNSFGEDRGNSDRVDIFWSKQRRELKILDNGRGMNAVSHLFVLGQGSGEGSTTDIGRYGQGGSVAILWLADHVWVWTMTTSGQTAKTAQNIRATVEDLEEWFEVDDAWARATALNTPPHLYAHGHGTLITMRLRAGRIFYPDPIRQRLSKQYAPALRSGRRIVWHEDGEESDIRPWDPGELGMCDEGWLSVRGLAAYLKVSYAPTVSERDAGISVDYGHRQIAMTKEPFGTYVGGKIHGYIDLAAEWRRYLTTNKDGITDESLWLELMAEAQKAMAAVLEYVREEQTEKFEAALKFEALLNLSPLLQKIKRGRPDPDGPDLVVGQGDGEGGEIDDATMPRPERHGVKSDDSDEPSGLHIVISGKSDAELNGRYMTAALSTDNCTLTVHYNRDNEVVQGAKEQRPPNMTFFRYLLADAICAELVERDLIVKSGLLSGEEWESLKNEGCGDLQLGAYIKPRLMRLIRGSKKRVA